MGDLTLKDKKPKKAKGEDLLDMMDDAAARPNTSNKNRSRSRSANKKKKSIPHE